MVHVRIAPWQPLPVYFFPQKLLQSTALTYSFTQAVLINIAKVPRRRSSVLEQFFNSIVTIV